MSSKFKQIMFFNIVDNLSDVKPSHAYLVNDDWDDWFTWRTMYNLYYVDADRKKNDIGFLKIARFNMDESRVELKKSFNQLPEDCFSLGQSDQYFENLNELGEQTRDKILIGLRDLSINESLFSRALKEAVTKRSLLRDVNPLTVRGQFNRLAQGGARLTEFQFTYTSPQFEETSNKLSLSFKVEPESNPPTNIHVVIGRNGVGKTVMLNNMIHSLMGTSPKTKYGRFRPKANEGDDDDLFANLVSVTFSAFDEAQPLADRKDPTLGIRYTYIGLKDRENPAAGPKNTSNLAEDFAKSVIECRNQTKISRWSRALQILETDPIFAEHEIASIASETNDSDVQASALDIFGRLSSGHKIVLLTITRLVETVEEKTLVLMDEPEGHLHPPLLSAFVRALSGLLTNRNGVAIIATHSPVVLQEVPKSCVWKLRRSGNSISADRLQTESFGENVGQLTRDVFGLEVTYSGFHAMITRSVERNDNFDSLLEEFGGNLGSDAQAIARVLLYLKNPNEENDEVDS